MNRPVALVTGVKGFTGRYMATALHADGWDVWGMGSQQPGSTDTRYHCVNLLDPVGVRAVVEQVQPDAVVHLAALAFVGHGDAEAFYNVNLLGTRNLLAALAGANHRPRKVLLASSANIYGNATGGLLAEATPAQPANDYAVSKLAMEHMARLWLPRLPIVIARPFNYTGPGQSPDFVIPKLVSHFAQRAVRVELGNLDVEREYNDVAFVCASYLHLLKYGRSEDAYNVCTGTTYALGTVIDMLRCITGHDVEVAVNPTFVRANEVHRLCGDPTRLQAVWNEAGAAWATPNLEQTLRSMLEARE